MKHFGDITKLSGHMVPLVDVVTGGSPCQDLSVAGKRAGLDGERSGLFMEQIRLVKEMRDESVKKLQMSGATFDIRHIRPRYMVWENVPGAFSSNKGEDFRCVLEEICRIKDKAANVPMPKKRKWSTSGCIMGNGWSIAWRVHDAQFWGVPQRRKRISLVADFGGESAPEILFECKGLSRDIEESREKGQGAATDIERSVDKAISFQERAGKSGGGNVPMVMESINGNIAGTLDANYYKGCGERQGVEREVVCVGNEQLAQAKLSDKVGTLNCMHDQQAILENQSVVRRLTPLECERLQGFPDHWTDIGEWVDSKGKKHKDADSPRYKALGNSIALPFWQWMAARMIKVLKGSGQDKPTMASLFDGIGGFPLVYSRCGCTPMWASEIEEFPIAVTKIRFPEE